MLFAPGPFGVGTLYRRLVSFRRQVVRTVGRSIGTLALASVTDLTPERWVELDSVQAGVNRSVSTLVSALLVAWVLDAYSGYTIENSIYGLALAGAGSLVLGGAAVGDSATEMGVHPSEKRGSLSLLMQRYVGGVGLAGGFALQLLIPFVEATEAVSSFLDVGATSYNVVLAGCMLVVVWLEGELRPMVVGISRLLSIFVVSLVATVAVVRLVFESPAGEIAFLGLYLLFVTYLAAKVTLPLLTRTWSIVRSHVVPAARAEFSRE